MSRIAERWNGGGTALVEAVAARSAVEALEQQPATRLAVRQREERLPHLLPRHQDGSYYKLEQVAMSL